MMKITKIKKKLHLNKMRHQIQIQITQINIKMNQVNKMKNQIQIKNIIRNIKIYLQIVHKIMKK